MGWLKNYSEELRLIKHAPSANRRRAIKRFVLIKDFQKRFSPSFYPPLSQTKALHAYSVLRGISYHSLLRWFVAYRKKGIRGLLPKYRIKVTTIRGLKGIKARNKKLIATIVIDITQPLKCIETLMRIIQQSRSIKAEVKAKACNTLKRYFKNAFYDHQLSLHLPLSDEEIKVLMRYKSGNHKRYSKKATALLMADEGRMLLEVTQITHAAKGTIYRWLRNFNAKRLNSIEVQPHSSTREARKLERRTRVIDIIHKMPSLYGINRTTWTYATIAEAYEREYGGPISVDKIQGVVKSTGYRWQHARRVLTSPDPDYKAKVEKILDTLQGLKEGERFFFIDEVGPYRVKKYGGRVLMPKDQTETISEPQKSRGKVQFVAALEAVTNQMTWKFTADKSAVSVIGLIEELTLEYHDCPAFFLTWDAISVHGSKAVMEWISAHNEASQGPHIEVVPLPSKSQFLNVIESVFCGMKKAVICNSDYADAREMQSAIARHFEERNQYYLDNPKRAGNKIWDKQSFDIDRLIGGLFKKM
jgi:transposase